MRRTSAARRGLLTLTVAAVATVTGVAAAVSPAHAQNGPSCPASVDTTSDGWICMQLILNTPTSSPSDQQIGLWEGVLNSSGRHAVADGIVFSDASVEGKVTAFYASELDRQPDSGALEFWSDVIEGARSELPFEVAALTSDEYLARFESAEGFMIGSYIDALYGYYLARSASTDEREYWARELDRGALSYEGLTHAIATSDEAGAVRTLLLYDQWTERPADTAGFAYWSDVAAQRGLYATIVDFSVADEVVETLGQRGMCLADGSC